MESTRKRKIIYTLLYIAVLIINVLIIVIFRDRAAITKYSIPSIVFAVASIAWAVIAISLREYTNLFFLNLYIFAIFAKRFDRSYNETQTYKNEFNMLAFVYCAAIPVFFTFSLFVDNFYEGIMRPLEVSIFRDITIVLLGIFHPFIKTIKAEKQKRMKEEADIKEQERRESMGKWK